MTFSESQRVLIVAAAVAALSSCTQVVARPPAAPTPTGQAPEVRQILDVLEARDQALSRFRAQAQLDYRSPERNFRSTQVVVVRGPASARIDVMNPFGVSYSVATDGKHLFAYDRRQSVYYHGTAQAESFERFIGIPMEAADFASVLRGLPPGLGDQRWSAVVPTEGGWLVRRRLGTGGVLDLIVDAATLEPVRVRISEDRERREVAAQFGDYRDVAGVTVAHAIEVSFKDGTHLEIVYKSVQRDVVLREEAFRIDRPAGARVVEIGAGGGGGV